jgi:hypothetical protein
MFLLIARTLRSKELLNLYSSLIIIIIIIIIIIRVKKLRRVGWARHVARMGEMKNVYKILVGKPEGKRPRRRKDPRETE